MEAPVEEKNQSFTIPTYKYHRMSFGECVLFGSLLFPRLNR